VSSPIGTPKEALIFLWGAGGVVVFLSYAIKGLVPFFLASLESVEGPMHHAGYAASVTLIGYAEGYKAFQRAFSPRVVARALWISSSKRPLLVALAPIVCMGLLHATKRRLISSWCVLFGVTLLVVLVRFLEQPWRGIVDAGVIVGLTWGTIAIVIFMGSALRGAPLSVPPDVPQ
jgi:hypothetical protein